LQETEILRIWEAAAELMRRQMSDLSYKSWILPIVPISMNDTTAVLMVESELQLSQVRTRHCLMIENSLEQVTGKARRCQFVLPGDIEKPREDTSTFAGNIMLNPKYTFDSFVVGASNRLAQAASLAVANTPGKAYNPLFIYGGVGLGKTHLMHAIGNHVRKYRPGTKLMYVTSENFTNDLITAIQTKKNIDFREKYRSLDLLLIDDIQFLAGRESTQEEFYNTFNELYTANKQIVISSDRPPKEMPMLTERLISRFEMGLVVDIQKPDFETTMAILKKKSESEGLKVPESVLVQIAQHVFTSGREMEGCLTRIIAFSAVTSRPIDDELAAEVMRDMRSFRDQRRITAEVITQCVGDYYGVNVLDIKSQKRSRNIADARQVAMYLMREMLSMSLQHIGAEFGGKDHSTVKHSCDKVAKEVLANMKLRGEIDDIKKKINNI